MTGLRAYLRGAGSILDIGGVTAEADLEAIRAATTPEAAAERDFAAVRRDWQLALGTTGKPSMPKGRP